MKIMAAKVTIMHELNSADRVRIWLNTTYRIILQSRPAILSSVILSSTKNGSSQK